MSKGAGFRAFAFPPTFRGNADLHFNNRLGSRTAPFNAQSQTLVCLKADHVFLPFLILA